MAEMHHILFVDDEPRVLSGMRRQLYSLFDECVMVFVDSGPAALQLLQQPGNQFDVIVTDIRMPGMDGIALLKQVQQFYPHMVRIVLTGHVERDSAMRAVGLAHQLLSKPCTADTLRLTLKNAFALRDLLSSYKLKQLVARLNTVPSLPALYNELLDEIYRQEASISKIGQIIAQDIGMTAKILQLVNSAFFGLRRQISDPAQAVIYLGLDTVKSLVLSVHVFEQFMAAGQGGVSLGQLQEHSLAVATLARQIAVSEQVEHQVADFAFTAGLLHEVGRLILAANLPADYTRVNQLMAQGVHLLQAETQVFNATHAEVGAYLLGIWGLPDRVVEAVAYLFSPSAVAAGSDSFSALAAVHVANRLLHQQQPGPRANMMLPELDKFYLMQINCHGSWQAWQQRVETDEMSPHGGRMAGL
ncbi:MAG: response regulator [Anaerolineae bacterium]